MTIRNRKLKEGKHDGLWGSYAPHEMIVFVKHLYQNKPIKCIFPFLH